MGAIINKIKRNFFDLTSDLVMKIPFWRFRVWYLSFFVKKIGKNVYIGKNIDIREPQNIEIGHNVVINKRVLLDGRKGLIIGDNVDIAQDARIWTLQHDYNDDLHSLVGKPVCIEDYSWICAGSSIMPGVVIEKGAVIASCAVVTRNVTSMTVVGGIPAKQIGVRKNELKYKLNYTPSFYRKQ